MKSVGLCYASNLSLEYPLSAGNLTNI